MNFDSILRNVSKHIALDTDEVEYFTSVLRPKVIKRKEYLLRTGEICLFDNFVVKGCFRSYYIDKNGFEHITMFAVENWWTGNLHSFLTNTPSTYYVQALEASEVLQIRLV